ncbi:MAG: hypothetical protein AAF414_13195 [Pseudomonadota bacterium]
MLLEAGETDVQRLGTRFLLYPQVPHLAGYGKPEAVWISTPPDELQPGPADRRMYVVDPLFEKPTYEYPYLPPFVGATHPPVEAGPDGHFDHLDVNDRGFVAAHCFAALRRVLDIWESYLGHEIVWHFAETYERMEIIPQVDWANAQSGYGYVEMGIDRADNGLVVPYALNFDVLAHELGHAIIFAEMGMPVADSGTSEYFGYHESVSDLISLISLLHFDSAVDRLLRGCKGNLLVMNELSRIAELSGDRQIRIASNERRMSTVTTEVHDMSRPFTGAIFDTLVEIYHANIIDRGLVEPPVDYDSERLREMDKREIEAVGAAFTDAYEGRHFQCKAALEDARDIVGTGIAQSWSRIAADGFSYAEAGVAIANVMDEMGEPDSAQIMIENLEWREILAPGQSTATAQTGPAAFMSNHF